VEGHQTYARGQLLMTDDELREQIEELTAGWTWDTRQGGGPTRARTCSQSFRFAREVDPG